MPYNSTIASIVLLVILVVMIHTAVCSAAEVESTDHGHQSLLTPPAQKGVLISPCISSFSRSNLILILTSAGETSCCRETSLIRSMQSSSEHKHFTRTGLLLTCHQKKVYGSKIIGVLLS
jgi:hypothetical protein